MFLTDGSLLFARKTNRNEVDWLDIVTGKIKHGAAGCLTWGALRDDRLHAALSPEL